MIHLIYISSATSWPLKSDLQQLLKQSQARNLKQDITGMLLYDNAIYMQVLEGSMKDVHDIYDSILKDTRNNGNAKLVEEVINQRNFPMWSMGFKNLEDCLPEELPGFIDIFNGKLDKEIAVRNSAESVKLLMQFANRHA